METTEQQQKILVIKLSALGDFIQALGPMAAIRKHHKDAHITLLTTSPFTAFAEKCGYFDEIWIDSRPGLMNIGGWLSFRQKLLKAGFDRIYDLQNNDRTTLYLRLFPKSKRPEWVGAAPGASHRNDSPERTAGHAFDGHVQTLALAGIKGIEIDNLGWLEADLSQFPLKKPYILLVPGSAPQHPQKRWPAENYAKLAQTLTTKGFQPVLLGTQAEAETTKQIADLCPESLDLTGKTSLFQIAALAKNAAGALGNDTGPMHIIGPTSCPTLVLFSGHSNPVRHAPKGKNIKTIQSVSIEDIPAEKAYEELKGIISPL